ncbi:L-rhamnose mutarotase [Actinacidiphila oryziradicis]|jgi:L-rhamnose mutarotase|uniref:L-rhamnose mutarotase n=1 Tax=Actinacidiphila oryziradicis TaxID=2571141 RepID=A0A4U0SIK0_9ACTN|nr:L-rhamnose mutarotase [Actinacidiphila oryziradicis]TKA08923.1 L-rhamnose mutarotase [Actinacidiphila oryziradicis]
MRLARIGDTGGERPEQPLSVQRFASVIRLRPEKEAEYRALHADAWPGVLAKLREVHIRNYSIYLRDGILFSYLEYDGDDYDADMAAMAADPETKRWWQLTDPCQQPVDSAADGQRWAPMEEVFHLD